MLSHMQTARLGACLRAVGLVESGSEAMRQLGGLRIRPEVDVEEVRRISQHVTVQRSDGDALLTQRPKD